MKAKIKKVIRFSDTFSKHHKHNTPPYLFMYLCQNVWKENDGGTDNNPKPDIDQ